EPDGRFAHFAFHNLSEFYADFGAYDVTIDTPDSMVVGATGRLEGEVRTSGRIERRYVQEDVHDFAFTAWDGFREVTGKSDDGKVALRCLYPAGAERAAEVEMDTARFGLAYFGKAYGPYPYGTLTIVHPPEGADQAGGMEYPTLITTGGPWYLPLTGARVIDAVTIHELGHEWFYGLVATDEHTFPFLDEGLNSYAEADALEARFPGSSALKTPHLELSLWAVGRPGSIERAPNAPVAQPAPAFLTGGDYGSLIYSRTASVLGTLANVYGADTVRRAVGRYTRRYRFEHPGPEQLLGVIDEVVGHDAAVALRAALFDRASVDYQVGRFSSARSEAPRGVFGDPAHPGAAPAAPPGAWTGEVLLRRLGALRFPVDVELHEEDGTIQRIRWEAREPAERLVYTGQSKLVAVVIDPEHHILLDENLANNAKRTARSLLGGPALERMLYGAEAALWGLQP
ncbi:MAG: M1 family aminopeptidase, partial [Byssovorax sp.]